MTVADDPSVPRRQFWMVVLESLTGASACIPEPQFSSVTPIRRVLPLVRTPTGQSEYAAAGHVQPGSYAVRRIVPGPRIPHRPMHWTPTSFDVSVKPPSESEPPFARTT